MLDAMRDEYLNVNANVHRGVHYLSHSILLTIPVAFIYLFLLYISSASIFCTVWIVCEKLGELCLTFNVF